MKSSTLFALFLLCAFFTSYLPSATADFVYDTDGDLLRNGGRYYVLPFIWPMGGGIEFAATGNETCPLTVVQSPSDDSKGLPIRFSSLYRILHIYEGLILEEISFTFAPPPCSAAPREWSQWTIVEGLPEGPAAVKLNGYKNTVAGWFKIERASHGHRFHAYKLVFCAASDGGTCGDIGIRIDREGNRHLVVTRNDPLLVQFQKVRSSSTASSTSTGPEKSLASS